MSISSTGASTPTFSRQVTSASSVGEAIVDVFDNAASQASEGGALIRSNRPGVISSEEEEKGGLRRRGYDGRRPSQSQGQRKRSRRYSRVTTALQGDSKDFDSKTTKQTTRSPPRRRPRRPLNRASSRKA